MLEFWDLTVVVVVEATWMTISWWESCDKEGLGDARRKSWPGQDLILGPPHIANSGTHHWATRPQLMSQSIASSSYHCATWLRTECGHIPTLPLSPLCWWLGPPETLEQFGLLVSTCDLTCCYHDENHVMRKDLEMQVGKVGQAGTGPWTSTYCQ